jgi:hypothetical protein
MSKWEVGSTVAEGSRTVLNTGNPAASQPWVQTDGYMLTSISTVNPATNTDISLISDVGGSNEGEMPSHSVPEPSTFLLMGLGLLGIGARRYIKSA